MARYNAESRKPRRQPVTIRPPVKNTVTYTPKKTVQAPVVSNRQEIYSAPSPSSGSGGGGYSGGGSSGGGYSGGGGYKPAAPAPMPKPKAPSVKNYLAKDAAFIAQQGALKEAMKNFMADDKASRSTYDLDYNKSLSSLGWDQDEKSWNYDDRNTASGASYRNQQNDFGARGMLQSTGYTEALDGLLNSLTEQMTNTVDARDTFLGDSNRAKSAFTRTSGKKGELAKAEAIARRAAQYNLN